MPSIHLNYFDHDSLSALLAGAGLVEIDRISSFPMELFPLMGMDYLGDREIGPRCHDMRMELIERIVAAGRQDMLVRFYRALASAGLGRTCCILARKQS